MKSWRNVRLRRHTLCSYTRGVLYFRCGRSRVTVRQADAGKLTISLSRAGELRRNVTKVISASSSRSRPAFTLRLRSRSLHPTPPANLGDLLHDNASSKLLNYLALPTRVELVFSD